MPPKAQICFLRSLLRFHLARTLLLGSPDAIVVKETELFQFCYLKTNLHICIHGF
jgi:hypothetical protein